MSAHRKCSRLIATAMVLLCGSAHVVHAKRPARFLLDGIFGATVPIGTSDYRDTFYPSPKFGLHLGAEIWLTPRIGIAPELALDGGPLIGQHSDAVTTGRLRFQPGLRFLIGFGDGHAFFLRFLMGGEALAYGPGGRGGGGTINVGFAAEPGLGMQFRISRRAVAGFTLGFPIGLHTYGTPTTSTNADLDISGFIGLRF